MKTKYLLLAVLLITLLGGCTDAQPGEITFASGVDSQGRPQIRTNSFAPGETVYLSIELLDAYAGLGMTATWKYGSQILKVDDLTASRKADRLDPLYVVSSLDTLRDWPEGIYSCDVFIPDHGVTTFEFTLVQEEQ